MARNDGVVLVDGRLGVLLAREFRRCWATISGLPGKEGQAADWLCGRLVSCLDAGGVEESDYFSPQGGWQQ